MRILNLLEGMDRDNNLLSILKVRKHVYEILVIIIMNNPIERMKKHNLYPIENHFSGTLRILRPLATIVPSR